MVVILCVFLVLYILLFDLWEYVLIHTLLKLRIHTYTYNQKNVSQIAFFPPYMLKRIKFFTSNVIRVQNNWFTIFQKVKFFLDGRMKHFDYSNCKHVSGFECSCCEETEDIIMDEIHAEIICLKCGLVLFDMINITKKGN